MSETPNSRLFKSLIGFSALFISIGLTVFLLANSKRIINESKQIDLEKRASWQKVAGTEGATFLLLMSVGAMGPLAAAEVALYTVVSYTVGALGMSAAAGLAAAGDIDQWVWDKAGGNAGSKKKRDLDMSYYINGTRIVTDGVMTMNSINTNIHLHDPYDSKLWREAEDILGEHHYNLKMVGHNDTVPANGKSKRSTKDIVADTTVAFVYAGADSNHAVMTNYGNYSIALTSLRSYITNGVRKRYQDGMWASYTKYGEEPHEALPLINELNAEESTVESGIQSIIIEQIQPCTQEGCYGIYDKGCMSVGGTSNPGDDSWIVGEYYWSQYGGLDNDCQSG